jgi:hypothetical protein
LKSGEKQLEPAHGRNVYNAPGKRLLPGIIDYITRFDLVRADLKAATAAQAIPDFRQIQQFFDKAKIGQPDDSLGPEAAGGDIDRALPIAGTAGPALTALCPGGRFDGFS